MYRKKKSATEADRMGNIFVISEKDVASRTLGEAVMEAGHFQYEGKKGDLQFFKNSTHLLVSTEKLHIHCELIDREIETAGMGNGYSAIIFLSSHRSASGTPSVTFHPVGNFGEAELGGRSRTLSHSSPQIMTHCLLNAQSSQLSSKYQVTFEATHHGPLTMFPALFAEIGSDETAWKDTEAARLIASAVLSANGVEGTGALGIGGGHYCPRFREIALKRKINFGHIVSSHNLKHLDSGMCEELRRKSPGIEYYILHDSASLRGELHVIEERLKASGFRPLDTEQVPLRQPVSP